MTIKLNIKNASVNLASEECDALKKAAMSANASLHEKNGLGNQFLGWVNLPSSISEADIFEIESTAETLAETSDLVVIAGIGGSYLGAKAVLEALGDAFQPEQGRPKMLFAGHHLDEDYMYELIRMLHGKRVSCIVISKSGTTTEPALAFRILKQYIEKQYGKEDAAKRIVAVTDKEKGALKQTADKEGYKTFVIPDDVGGRFSVLTPVGLLPIAVAGFDIRLLLKGAADMELASGIDAAYENNICAQYAVVRNALYKQGKHIELLANYSPKLHFLAEWWKQLFGESEGKQNKGIFPASVDFTSDLHSLGQYIQQGERILFETVISIKNPQYEFIVPEDPENLDQLNFMATKRISEVNRMAELGTMLAHLDGGVPNIRIEIPELSAYFLGQLIYFFQKACGISGYMLEVNPFDQPGVEDYKRNMFALLGKPGYEAENQKLMTRIE
ncbi:MAG: glucose-6-phosphate isomerase [Prevotellaceae bacterium]|jgi:glucose-6-phosphate isomerase|nr:glucose-6-phosphate isomerase [Prevotellaceae bacterium]